MISPVVTSVGKSVKFSGYADDFGNHIRAVEFSLDGGKTWVSQDTSESDPNLAIHWTYTFTPHDP